MKRKTTKEILAESFREIANKRPVDKITIQEIVDNCDYSPATFYRHFKDKYDLIAWDYVYNSSIIMSKVGVDNYEWKDTLTDGMKYFFENKEYMKNLLENTNGHDAFKHYLSEANIEHLSNCVMKVSKRKELDSNLRLLIRIYCLGTVEMVCQWLIDESQYDGNYLATVFEEALPQKLCEILCQK